MATAEKTLLTHGEGAVNCPLSSNYGVKLRPKTQKASLGSAKEKKKADGGFGGNSERGNREQGMVGVGQREGWYRWRDV